MNRIQVIGLAGNFSRINIKSIGIIGYCIGFVLLTQSSYAKTLQVPKEHATIQAAIDSSTAGDLILVQPGIYKECICLKPNLVVRSAGKNIEGELGLERAERTIITGVDSDGQQPGVQMAENSTLDGFTVTGVGEYDEVSWNHHYETNGAEQTYDKIGKPGVAGISVMGISGCKVQNNIVHHIGYTGIVVIGCHLEVVAPQITNNICYRNMGGGIGSLLGSEPVIKSNTCFENFYAGIGHATAANSKVIGNECYRNIRAGIGISEGSKPIVKDNKCYENRRAGIGVRTGKDTIPVIENNECFNNQMAGIGVSDHAGAIIRSNRCYENKEAGIGCRDGASPLIEHNECYKNEMSGIGSRLEASPTIRGNICHHNKTAGIGTQDHARAIVVNNQCYQNIAAGIGVEEHAEATIRDNECYENQKVGIGVRSEAKATIESNQCQRNHLAGIGVEQSAEATVRGNTCVGNGQAGIGIDHQSNVNVIGNHCLQNARAGIGVRGGSKAILSLNQCRDNGAVALGIDEGSNVQAAKNQLSRVGGMPPMVAIKGNSTAWLVGNTIQGGGVAGILVQGTAKILGNTIEGNGPRKGPGPPNFAVWGHEGADISMVSNSVSRWRHAVSTHQSESVQVVQNKIRDFLGRAIVIQGTTGKNQVLDNLAMTLDDEAICLMIDGKKVEGNKNLTQMPDADSDSDADPDAEASGQ